MEKNLSHSFLLLLIAQQKASSMNVHVCVALTSKETFSKKRAGSTSEALGCDSPSAMLSSLPLQSLRSSGLIHLANVWSVNALRVYWQYMKMARTQVLFKAKNTWCCPEHWYCKKKTLQTSVHICTTCIPTQSRWPRRLVSQSCCLAKCGVRLWLPPLPGLTSYLGRAIAEIHGTLENCAFYESRTLDL